MFSKHVGKKSNEVEAMAIPEVLDSIYLDTFHNKLIVESESSNAISNVNLLL